MSRVPYTITFTPEHPLRLTFNFPEEGWAQVIRYQDWCEELFKEISDWCEIHKCGRRTSWNNYHFKNKKEMSMFLLRWKA